MKQKSKFFGALRWSVVDRVWTRLISTAVFLFLASKLNPEDFGIVAIAALFGEFTRPLIDQGFSMALVQREKLDELHRVSAFWVSMLVGITVAVIALLVAEPIAVLFENFASLRKAGFSTGEPEYSKIAEIVRWLSFGFLMAPLAGVPSAIMKRDLNFKSLAIRNCSAILAAGIVGVSMVVLGFGVWSLVGYQLTYSIVGVIALYWLGDWYPSFQFSLKHALDLLKFGTSVTGKGMLQFFNRQTDVILVGLFLGASTLGVYSVACRVFRQFSMFLNGTVAQVTFPKFSQLQNEDGKLVDAFFRATQMSAVVAFPFFAGVACIARELFPLLGQQWEGCVPILQILAVVGMVHSIVILHGNVMLSRGRAQLNLLLSVINTVANIIVFACAVHFGILLVASAFAIRALVMFPVGVKFTKESLCFQESQYYQLLLPPLIASIMMALAVVPVGIFFAETLSPFRIVVLKVLVGLVVYPAVIRICSRRLFNETVQVVFTLLPIGNASKKTIQTL